MQRHVERKWVNIKRGNVVELGEGIINKITLRLRKRKILGRPSNYYIQDGEQV